MTTPWLDVDPLDDDAFREFRRRAIFDCHKWDPQVGDVGVIARVPLVISKRAWREVSDVAERLAAETMQLEAELLTRPDLHRRLGLPRAVRQAMARGRDQSSGATSARLIRFDFHFTTEGWRVSEANTDVPGGLNEASGYPALMAAHVPGTVSVGDPAGAYCNAVLQSLGERPTIALVHATAYCDDSQMMAYLAKRLRERGATAHLASPAHVQWEDSRAHLDTAWSQSTLDAIVRFFPGEWLPALPRRVPWSSYFSGSATPMSNPATALLTQTKRLPLVWSDLDTPVPAWKQFLPETHDPRDVAWRRDDGWVLKPALGRVGEGIGLRSVVPAREIRRIARAATWWPRQWVAQRRFDIVPVRDRTGHQRFPCLGVYTVNGRAVGAYGRLGTNALIDGHAQDAAVLCAA